MNGWHTLDPHIRQIAETELTPRQLQILQHWLNGHPLTRIASALHLAPSTVRAHRDRALAKLEPHIRKDAA